MDEENKSPHILNTSSNLLGICFVVLTSLKVLKLSAETVNDEFTLVLIFLLMSSCIFSFLSMRSVTGRGQLFESIADYLFLTSLIVLFITILLFTFNVIR